LVRGMGVARFGVLSLAWVVVGYFSLFDLGLGRALTKLVADRLASHEEEAIPPLVWTSILMMFLLGLASSLVTWTITPLLVYRVLKIPAELQAETVRGFHILALSVPIVTVTSGLRGVLEAQHRFRLLNVIRIPMSIFSFAGPLLALPFSPSLVPVISILLAGRLLGLAAHVWGCFRAMPTLRHTFVLRASVVPSVLRFSGWLTVSNIVGPVMSYLDRFLIGSLLSVATLAYYTAPFDMVTRVTVIPLSVVGVLFPAFAWNLIQDPSRAGLLLIRGLKYIFLTVFPILLVIVALAPEALRLWLGSSFAEHGAVVLRWIAAGVFVNCLATVPFAFVQSAGRPDMTAKLHLLELPLYLIGIWTLTKKFGIEGSAIAWTTRVILDAAVLFLFARQILPRNVIFLTKLTTTAAVGLLWFYLAILPQSLSAKILFLLLSLFIYGLAGWIWGLDTSERVFLLRARTRGQSTI